MKIRRAITKDIRLYFDWRNEKLVRETAFTTESVPWDNHVAWFWARLDNETSVLYVVVEDDLPIGQVRFECADRNAEINYSMDVSFRGQSKAVPMMKLALEQLQRDKPETTQFTAYVKPDNTPSIRVFEKLDFQFRGYDEKKGGNRYTLNVSRSGEH